MNDELRERYEETPYRQGAFPVTHPARVGAIARIFGLAPASPDRCRVLELGCGEANNLLPLAERFPLVVRVDRLVIRRSLGFSALTLEGKKRV